MTVEIDRPSDDVSVPEVADEAASVAPPSLPAPLPQEPEPFAVVQSPGAVLVSPCVPHCVEDERGPCELCGGAVPGWRCAYCAGNVRTVVAAALIR